MTTNLNRNYSNKQQGFTLIELLIVIAIIAVLAAIILGSLGSARTKATDAKIKQQLTSMRSLADLYTGTGTAFAINNCATTAGTLFETANRGLGSLLAGITLGTTATRCVSTVGQPSDGNVVWAVAAQMSSGAWCVDSSGWSSDKRKDTGALYSSTLTAVINATTCF